MDFDEQPRIPLHHPAVRGAALAIVDGCEAFLTGTYAELVADEPGDVPAWIVLNRVAHATADELRTLVAGDALRPSWFDAEQRVAARVLDSAAGDDDEVRRIQRAALVPLELWLAGPGRETQLGADAVLALAGESLAALIDSV
jgi:hypothetical protein